MTGGSFNDLTGSKLSTKPVIRTFEPAPCEEEVHSNMMNVNDVLTAIITRKMKNHVFLMQLPSDFLETAYWADPC